VRPTHLRHSRVVALLVPLLASGLLLLTGCGGNTPAAVDTPSPTLTSTPTPTPSTPAPTPTPKPTPTKTVSGGNGDADEPTKPATAGGGICGKLSAAEVGGVLGGTVTGSALAGTTGCKFVQADRKAAAVTITDVAFGANGMSAAKNDATSAVEGTPEDLSGIGTEAFVVTGTMFGGPDTQAAGAVHVGNRVISVVLEQHRGLSAAQVRDLVIHTLRLVVQQR
jgi:hypothetical protein